MGSDSGDSAGSPYPIRHRKNHRHNRIGYAFLRYTKFQEEIV